MDLLEFYHGLIYLERWKDRSLWDHDHLIQDSFEYSFSKLYDRVCGECGYRFSLSRYQEEVTLILREFNFDPSSYDCLSIKFKPSLRDKRCFEVIVRMVHYPSVKDKTSDLFPILNMFYVTRGEKVGVVLEEITKRAKALTSQEFWKAFPDVVKFVRLAQYGQWVFMPYREFRKHLLFMNQLNKMINSDSEFIVNGIRIHSVEIPVEAHYFTLTEVGSETGTFKSVEFVFEYEAGMYDSIQFHDHKIGSDGSRVSTCLEDIRDPSISMAEMIWFLIRDKYSFINPDEWWLLILPLFEKTDLGDSSFKGCALHQWISSTIFCDKLGVSKYRWESEAEESDSSDGLKEEKSNES